MLTLAADLYLLVAAYGLALPVAYAGLPVLGQGAFVAVGAFGTFQLAAHGTPLLVAVMASVAIAAAAGYLLGFGAARLAGASLALGTWGLAWLAYLVLVQFPRLSGGSGGLTHESPATLDSPSLGVVLTLHPWVHVLVAGLIVALIAAALLRSATGPWALDWAALRTGAALAESLGVPVQRRRRALLAAAAALGALGGAGGAVLQGVIAPVDFSPLLSLQLFVAVVVGGVASWWGPVVGVGLLAALPWTSDRVADLLSIDPLRARGLLTALLLVAALLARSPVSRLLQRLRRQPPDTVPAEADSAPTVAAATDEVLVSLTGARVSYRAVRALDGVDLDLHSGEVHALVGPNGSGKSTALRVLAGVVTPEHGAVVIAGAAVATTADPSTRVRLGVARTLQRTATLGDLRASTQVAVGARARERQPFLGLRHLLATPHARRAGTRRRATSHAALRSVGMQDRADVAVERLNSAEQRLLQVARAVATGARALLLDEPAAGMSRQERDALVAVIRRLAADGHGVLLVEHDMGLVARVADRVTVLSEGRVLATGTAEQVRHDSAVRATYLGEVDPPVPNRRPPTP